MQDILTIHEIRRAPSGDVFDPENPAQAALRSILSEVSEAELVRIEDDLRMHGRTGVLSTRLEDFFTSVSSSLATAA